MKRFDLKTDWKATGNQALDGCVSCIIYYRERGIALESISLRPAFYHLFKIGVEKMLKRKLEDEELMQIDHVKIDLGSLFQPSTILPNLITKPKIYSN
jgi:hypothetical protein